jgi:cytochrome c peroxidase
MFYIDWMRRQFFAILIAILCWFCQGSSLKLQRSCPPGLKQVDGRLCELDVPYPITARVNGVSSWRELEGKAILLDPAVIDLGRYLFFDPMLSKDQNMSCATCHNPKLGLSDGQKRSIGNNGTPVLRSAPALWNLAFSSSFFWDGRVATLEKQVTEPIFNADEMANNRDKLLSDLNQNAIYRHLFADAFHLAKTEFIGLSHVEKALASFLKSLTSFNSRYDRYIQGDATAFSATELRGFNVFRSFVTRCSECHVPPLFTNQQIVVTGVPDDGVGDFGAGRILGDPYNRAFKIPSLRNIARTPPYMHAGNFADLDEVVDFYNDGGGRPEKVERVHWHVRKLSLSKAEKTALISFLGTLTDESHLPLVPESVPSGIDPTHFN